MAPGVSGEPASTRLQSHRRLYPDINLGDKAGRPMQIVTHTSIPVFRQSNLMTFCNMGVWVIRCYSVRWLGRTSTATTLLAHAASRLADMLDSLTLHTYPV